MLETLLIATVIAISDGDTLTVLTPENQQVQVRLAEIDAPERMQPFGSRSRQSLSNLCYRKPVKLTNARTDRDGHKIASVYCDGTNVNTEQIRRGYAWVHERRVNPNLFALHMLQAEARVERRGLWFDHNPVPPWEWRRQRQK